MTTKEKAIAEIEKIIADINPVTEEMKSVIFYLKVAENYIFNLEDQDFFEGKIMAYEEVLHLFNTHQDLSGVAGTIRFILDNLKKDMAESEGEPN
jgi:ABC-type Fe3+-citrate transport system substrate-binding protein